MGKYDENLEIERKFLVERLPDNRSIYPSYEISQGYAIIDGQNVRVRKSIDNTRESTYTYTRKRQLRDGVRIEEEKKISAEEFSFYWDMTKGKRVFKTRYSVPHGELLFEFDQYHANLAGLITVEVEFASEEASTSFVPPKEFIEVTNREEFSNYALARNGIPQEFRV